MLRIYPPVELSAELETGSRLPTGEYTPPFQTQLNWTQHAQFSLFLPNPSAVVVNSYGPTCDFNYTPRDADATRVDVGDVYNALVT